MRVLFLTDDYLDYTADPLYLGLSRVLGDDHVVDYPYKASFHEPGCVPWYLVPRQGKCYSREEIMDLLRDKFFDLACIASFRQEGLQECQSLYAQVPFPPIVFVDGSDDAKIRHGLVATYPIVVYFKRDYMWKMGRPLRDQWDLAMTFRGDRRLFAKTTPLPLSIVTDTLPNFGHVRKDIDVSYRGRASHPRRVKAVNLLSSMDGIRFTGAVYASPGDRTYKLKAGPLERSWTKLFDNRRASEQAQQQKMDPDTYYREIATSKIALSLRGGGATASLRYYEIVAMGAMLLSDAPETVIPNDFENRRHAVYCRPDLKDLQDLVRYYLKHDVERESIIAEGQAHLLKHHTCERRAEYFLNVCGRAI